MANVTNKALFRVVGNTTSPSSARGYNAVAGESLSFQLEDSTGVLSVLWETYDPASPSSPLATLNAPTFPFTGSSSPAYTNGVSPFSAAAVAPTPSGGQPLSNSYFVRCTAATASGPQSFTRSINVTNGTARKPIPGESTENSPRGWADDWANLIENTVGHGGIQPADGIHGIISGLGPYTTAVLRRAAVLTSADIGKVALQTDTSPPTMWVVLGVSSGVGTWMLINTTADAGVDPPSIITSGGALNAWYRGDTVVQSGGFVSQWTDKMGNSLNHLVQATGANQPAFTATDGTLNNQPTLLGDGVNDWLTASGATVGAVYWIGAVIKQITWVNNARLIISNTSGASKAGLIQSAGTPNLNQFEAGVGGNGPSANAPTGAWRYVEWASNNTTSDFLRVGSDIQTGVASGRTTSSSAIWAFSDGAHFASCAIAEIVVANYIPTLTERNNMRTYVSSRYLASLLT